MFVGLVVDCAAFGEPLNLPMLVAVDLQSMLCTPDGAFATCTIYAFILALLWQDGTCC